MQSTEKYIKNKLVLFMIKDKAKRHFKHVYNRSLSLKYPPQN